MNLFSQFNYWDSTRVIGEAIDYFGEHIVSCHLKDIYWDYNEMFLFLKEVMIGEGVLGL